MLYLTIALKRSKVKINQNIYAWGERIGRGRDTDGRSRFIVLVLEVCKGLLILKLEK